MRFLCFIVFLFMSFYSCKTDHKEDSSQSSSYGNRSRSSGYESYAAMPTIPPEKLEKIVVLDQEQGGALSLDNTDIAVITAGALAAATALVLGGMFVHGKMTAKEAKLEGEGHSMSSTPSQHEMGSIVYSRTSSASKSGNSSSKSSSHEESPSSAIHVEPSVVTVGSYKIPVSYVSESSIPVSKLVPEEPGKSNIVIGSKVAVKNAKERLSSEPNVKTFSESLEDGKEEALVISNDVPLVDGLPAFENSPIPEKLSPDLERKILTDNTHAESMGYFQTLKRTFTVTYDYTKPDLTKILKWRLKEDYLIIVGSPEKIRNTNPQQWKISYKTHSNGKLITKNFIIAPWPDPVSVSGIQYYHFTTDMVRIVNP